MCVGSHSRRRGAAESPSTTYLCNQKPELPVADNSDSVPFFNVPLLSDPAGGGQEIGMGRRSGTSHRHDAWPSDALRYTGVRDAGRGWGQGKPL